jgi:hypothetical protein
MHRITPITIPIIAPAGVDDPCAVETGVVIFVEFEVVVLTL